MKRFGLAFLALAGVPTGANAQLVCTVNSTPVTFDTITTSDRGTYDGRGTITVTCTGSQGANIAACIDLGESSAVNTSGKRLLTTQQANVRLPLQIFRDASLTKPWSGAAMEQSRMVLRVGDGTMSATVYLRLYIQQGIAVAGTYSAQFPVTLRYGTVTGNFWNCNTFGNIAVGPAASIPPVIPVIARKR